MVREVRCQVCGRGAGGEGAGKEGWAGRASYIMYEVQTSSWRPWRFTSIFKIFIYLFDCAGSSLQHVGSSSLTGDRTQAPCIGSADSQPLGLPGKPLSFLSRGMMSSNMCFCVLERLR